MSDAIAQFANAKYFSLESFRKTGVGVRTPVWFAQDVTHGASADAAGGKVVFYVYSAPEAGKVKRIRNNPKVRIAPCTIRGQLRGGWVDGQARLCAAQEAEHGQELLRRKYGWLKKVGDFFARWRGRNQPVIAIEV
jgi:uncharacterized protein